jgi:Xaa-Pro aminopeptidase
MLIQEAAFTAGQIHRFTQLQRELYTVLEAVADTMEVGESEQAVAARIRHALKAYGVRSWFHVPVALFGERTAYPGAFGQLEALPTRRTLAQTDAVILDAAPIIDGHLIDCSLAVPRAMAPEDEAAFERCDALLAELRALILARAQQHTNMRSVAREVDALITARGFQNCHRKHIGAVLAHRANYTAAQWLARRRLWGLSPAPVSWFFARSVRASRGRPQATPNWNHTRQSDTPLQPGLWCVEPHVALGHVGVKFEELLLVDADGARWLDDDLPHHRRWRMAYAGEQ